MDLHVCMRQAEGRWRWARGWLDRWLAGWLGWAGWLGLSTTIGNPRLLGVE
jgi:hypothetical protein